MAIRTYISIITLNVNGLNVPTKRHRLAECIQKQYPNKYLKQTHFRPKDTYRLKVRGWKIFHANENQNFISDKTISKIKNVSRDKE